MHTTQELTSTRVKFVTSSPTLEISQKIKELQKNATNFEDKPINLTIGEPHCQTPKHIEEAAKEAIDRGLTKMSMASGVQELREAIASKLNRENQIKCDAADIVVTNGAKQAIFNSLLSIINPGDYVIIPSPYWMSYVDMVRIAEGIPIFINTTAKTNFKITPEQLEKTLCKYPARAIFLNSPCNPTGSVYTKQELADLAEIIKKYNFLHILSDDVYEKIIWDNQFNSILNVAPELSHRTFVINSMSKTYAMTGWRVGYVCCKQKEITAKIAAIQSQSTSGINTIAQYAAIHALTSSQDCVQKMRDEYYEAYQIAYTELNKINGMLFQPTQGAFYAFPNIKTLMDNLKINTDAEFVNFILAKGKVGILPGSIFGLENHVRISLATDKITLMEAFKRLQKACS